MPGPGCESPCVTSGTRGGARTIPEKIPVTLGKSRADLTLSSDGADESALMTMCGGVGLRLDPKAQSHRGAAVGCRGRSGCAHQVRDRGASCATATQELADRCRTQTHRATIQTITRLASASGSRS